MKTMKTKAILLSLLLSLSAFAYSANPADNDTIPAAPSKVTSLIEEPTTTSSGKKTTRYYFIYDGELISTSKSVAESYKLAKKHGARCPLAIVKKKSGKGKKRIILN